MSRNRTLQDTRRYKATAYMRWARHRGRDYRSHEALADYMDHLAQRHTPATAYNAACQLCRIQIDAGAPDPREASVLVAEAFARLREAMAPYWRRKRELVRAREKRARRGDIPRIRREVRQVIRGLSPDAARQILVRMAEETAATGDPAAGGLLLRDWLRENFGGWSQGLEALARRELGRRAQGRRLR